MAVIDKKVVCYGLSRNLWSLTLVVELTLIMIYFFDVDHEAKCPFYSMYHKPVLWNCRM